MREEDLSNTAITPDGLIQDLSGGAEVPCPTCKGKGRIIDPQCKGRFMSYYNPYTGSSIPEITCRTCKGEGWVFIKNTTAK